MKEIETEFIIGILKLYVDTVVNKKAPKCYTKSTGQEYSGQVYFTEKIGLRDGQCNQVEYR